MLIIPHCLDIQLTDGDKLFSLKLRAHSTPQKYYFSGSDSHFYLRLSLPEGLMRQEGSGKLKTFPWRHREGTCGLWAYRQVPHPSTLQRVPTPFQVSSWLWFCTERHSLKSVGDLLLQKSAAPDTEDSSSEELGTRALFSILPVVHRSRTAYPLTQAVSYDTLVHAISSTDIKGLCLSDQRRALLSRSSEWGLCMRCVKCMSGFRRN
jgi:hypothetical protein